MPQQDTARYSTAHTRTSLANHGSVCHIVMGSHYTILKHRSVVNPRHCTTYETFITCSLLAGSLGFSPKLPAAGAHCKVVAFHPLDLLRVCSSWHPSCHPSWHPSCHPSWHPSCHPSCCIPLAPPLYSNPVINPVIPCGAQRKDKRASMPPLMLLWCAA